MSWSSKSGDTEFKRRADWIIAFFVSYPCVRLAVEGTTVLWQSIRSPKTFLSTEARKYLLPGNSGLLLTAIDSNGVDLPAIWLYRKEIYCAILRLTDLVGERKNKPPHETFLSGMYFPSPNLICNHHIASVRITNTHKKIIFTMKKQRKKAQSQDCLCLAFVLSSSALQVLA